MAGIASSLAQGFESGYGLGLRTDAANESKRRAGVMEENERKQSARAEAELGLRTRAQERLEAQQTEAFERGRAKDVLDVTGTEIKDLIAAAATGAATEDMAARYGHLQKVRQGAIDLFTRAKAGQADPKTLDPDDFYIATAMATGRTPEDIQASPKYIADIQAGVEGKNPSLTLKGANGLLAPYLRRGLGEASPHGGTIARKEVIGLDPHPQNPEYLIPRLRVYVKTDDGAEKFYDAPMTKGGSTGADDQVVGIDMKRAFDFMGNLGTLAAGLSERDIAQKLAQVSPGAKEQTQRWLTELNNRGKASQPKVGATEEKIRAIQKFAVENNVSFDEAARSIQAAGVTPGAPKQLTPLQTKEIESRIKVNEARAGKLGGGGKGGGSGKAAAPGAGVKSAALGGVEAPADKDEAIDFWARAVIAGDRDWQVGIGRSKTGAQLIEAVKRRVPQLAKQMGLEPQDIGTTRAESAAFAATMKELTKRSEAVELFASKVDKDMKTFDDLLDKAALSSPLLINKPINALRRQFSDPELAQLDLAAKQVGAEYERLITGGTLSVAQLHVGAAEDAKKLINGDMPPKQARAVMQTMRQEMANAKAAAHESEQRIKGRMQGLGRGRDAGAAAPAKPAASGGGSPPVSALKEGQVTTFANGQKWTLKNGQPAKVQ